MSKHQTHRIRINAHTAAEFTDISCHLYTPINTDPEDPEYDDLRADPYGNTYTLYTEELNHLVDQYMHGKCLMCSKPLPDDHQGPALCGYCTQSVVQHHEHTIVTTPYLHTYQLAELTGKVVTLKRGMSTLVGVLRCDITAGTWRVCYRITDEQTYMHTSCVYFTNDQVMQVGWDKKHDRPYIEVLPLEPTATKESP